jgi:hypothetical protein
MERWLVGAQLTLDFFGNLLHQHPLRVASIAPPDAVRTITVTGHSVVLELKNSPVRPEPRRAPGSWSRAHARSSHDRSNSANQSPDRHAAAHSACTADVPRTRGRH